MAAPSLRRSTRLVPAINALPADVLAGALAFLDAPSLVRASGVCRRWRGLLDERPAVWEGALSELDPCAVLGPAGFAAAVGAGKTPLRLVHALGDSRCGKCGRRGARYYAPVAARRACGSACVPPGDAGGGALINRFFFLRADEPGAMRVSTRDELVAAVKACDARDPRSCDVHLNTVVLTRDIDVDSYLPLDMLKLCGQPGLTRKPRLTSVNVCFVVSGVVLEDLHMEVGMPWDDSYRNTLHFPALETGSLPVLAHNCVVQGNVGSAVMLEEHGAVSLHGCTIVSQMYYGVIAKPPERSRGTAVAPQFTLSVRGCSFTESLWHIAVGFKLTAADMAALRDSNTFSSGAVDVSDVKDAVFARKLSDVDDKIQGCVQPWRRGALAAALRAARTGAAAAGCGGGPASKRLRREG